MERAGRAAAQDSVKLTLDRPGAILIACGPGNNGGDGFVMAEELLRAGRKVVVAFNADPSQLPADAARAYMAWRRAGGKTYSEIPDPPVDGWALVVDALFGIGLKRSIEGIYAQWIRLMSAENAPRLALDIPSGLDADTGRCLGETFKATHTTTFIALKPGLMTLDGPDFCGHISLQRLEVDALSMLPPFGMSVSPILFQEYLLPRRRNSHKGSFGDVTVVGGAQGMVGAALLAGRAAIKLGAGRVYIALVSNQMPWVDFEQPELMIRSVQNLPDAAGVWVVGPGLSQNTNLIPRLCDIAAMNTPLVLDADALNLLATSKAIQQAINEHRAPLILTPHPAEAARLMNVSVTEIQANRVYWARKMAEHFNAWVVLKGCGSIIAGADGRWFINTSGNPGMASGGTGDVLSGFIGSLWGQGWRAEYALTAAVHLHGAAADALSEAMGGPQGLTAHELIEPARRLLNAWIYSDAP